MKEIDYKFDKIVGHDIYYQYALQGYNRIWDLFWSMKDNNVVCEKVEYSVGIEMGKQ